MLKQKIKVKKTIGLPHSPFITVKTVTAREVNEFGDFGGFKRLNLLFTPMASLSSSLVGASRYLHDTKRKI